MNLYDKVPEPRKENIYWVYPEGTVPTKLIDLTLERRKEDVKVEGEVLDDENLARKVKTIHLDEFDPICLSLYGLTVKTNDNIWHYELTGPSQFELLHYDGNESGYETHQDTMYFDNGLCRKLSIVTLLSDTDNFEGGKFYIQYDGVEKTYIDLKKGSVIIFPPYLLHGVEPVTSGERIAISGWLTGPNFK